MLRENIGPSHAKVWNSPRSPQGSTPAGNSHSSSASNRRPANDGPAPADRHKSDNPAAHPQPSPPQAGPSESPTPEILPQDRYRPASSTGSRESLPEKDPQTPSHKSRRPRPAPPPQPCVPHTPHSYRETAGRPSRRAAPPPQLFIQQHLPIAMDSHPPKRLIDRSQQPHNLILTLEPQQVQRHALSLPPLQLSRILGNRVPVNLTRSAQTSRRPS